MSEIITDLVWYPPQFPEQGRLPTAPEQVGANCKQQDSHEIAYRDQLCAAANRREEPPCCKTLHISLFFDGTGNNMNYDIYGIKENNPQAVPHPTNIARLFQATIGQGYAGGLGVRNQEVTDIPESGGNKYYKYYMPGVGTPFPEIKDLDFTMKGLAFASHGEDRVNWGLLRIIDALRRTMDLNLLTDKQNWESVQAMGTSMATFGLTGSSNRYEEFMRLLAATELATALSKALMTAEPGKSKLLGIKLYVYGFSRGAAAARAFVNWLSELLPEPENENAKPEQCLTLGALKIPLSVEFLGLLDTVASVGVPHLAPIAEGHMGWADDNQELPAEETYGGFIKRCVHLVSSHEQRLCFPLDSIRRSNGKYPAMSEEVVYPGMHSDIGGGYPPGDQGKATGPDDSLLLSQIALHDMYASAFAAGAPLKVRQAALPDDLKKDVWRTMQENISKEFDIKQVLIQRFNSWRELTLGLIESQEGADNKQAVKYTPPRASCSLELALERQLGWITAWRIDRYARGTCTSQRFYKDAAANGQDKDHDPVVRAASEKKRADAQKKVEDARKAQEAEHKKDDFILYPPGPKDFDAALGQTQLTQAAVEFHEDYRDFARSRTQTWSWEPLYALNSTMFLLNSDDEYAEWNRMKTAGEQHLAALFPKAGEQSNAEQPGGLVRALFDDQIHDSRAWFMHNAFGAREPWGGYFRYRMVYFGSECNKQMSPLMIAGAVIGAATLVGGVAFIIKQKGLPNQLLAVAGLGGALALEVEVMDLLSGQPVAMLPGFDYLQSFTKQPGIVAAQQKTAIAEQRLAQAKSIAESGWVEKAQSVITA